MSLRELIKIDNEYEVDTSEKVSFDVTYYNFDIQVTSNIEPIEGAKGRAISGVIC